MKLRSYLFLLMVCSSSAFGEHHRQHALGYLNTIPDRVETILLFTRSIASRIIPGTHPQQLTWENNEIGGIFPGNIEGIGDRVASAMNALEGNVDPLCYQLGLPDSADTLDCARRLINQPNPWTGVRSALQFSGSAMYGMFILTLWEEGCDPTGQWCSDADVSIVLTQLNEVWKNLDSALWHINDAIREETYGDLDFAE